MSFIKRFSFLLSFVLSTISFGQGFSPIYSCPGPYACILSGYLGLQFPDGSQQSTAAVGSILTIGTIDSQTPQANGAKASGSTVYMQSASATVPGLVNITSQSLKGVKTFIDGLIGNLTGNVTGTASGNALVTRLINTTSPITGGGDLSADRTIAIPLSTNSVDGYLSAADHTSFSAKQAPGNYVTSLTGEVTGSGPGATATTVVSVDGSSAANIHAAELAANAATSANTASTIVKRDSSGNIAFGTATGALTGIASGNPPNTRLINTTAPLTGGGDLSADRTITIPVATGSVNGYLASSDWTIFNSKQAAGNYVVSGGALGTPSSGTATNLTGTASGLTAGTSTATNALNSATTTIDVSSATAPSAGQILKAVDSTHATWQSAGAGGITTLTGDVTATGSGSVPATVAAIQGTTVTGTSGTGNVLFDTAPVMIGPSLGTPASGIMTNVTGTASGLTAGTVTTNANLNGPIASTGNTTTVTSQTGTGTTFVMNTSPTLVTANLGTPTTLVGTNITGTAAGLTAGTATAANALNSATTAVSTLAATAPTAGQILQASNGTTATWVTRLINTTSPLTGGGDLSADRTIAIPVATGSVDGYLAASDWTIFNNKQSTLTLGNLTDVGTDGITIGSGTGAVVGSGTTISQHVADTTHAGYLASADWNTFNGKQDSGSYLTALTGDVTASGPGSVAATIANNAVTNAKIANSTIDLTAKVTGVLPNANTTAASANTASTIVARDASGNFTAGTVSAALTGVASGNTTYTANQFGVVLSGSGNTMSVLAPDASTTKVLTSGGTGANPTWSVIPASGTSTPTASTTAQWDANVNMSANSFIPKYTTTAKNNGTVTLTATSTQLQYFTTTNDQNVVLPVTSTLALGQSFTIVDLGGGNPIVVKSSGGNTIVTMAGTAGAKQTFTCILTSGTGTASWAQSLDVTGAVGASNGNLIKFTAGGNGFSLSDSGLLLNSLSSTPSVTGVVAVLWNNQLNLLANNFIPRYTTTATAAGTTTLTNASTYYQFFTGSTTQTVTLPVTSTLDTTGYTFAIYNNSTGAVTVNSSGGNAVQVLAAGSMAYITAILLTGTTAASWQSNYKYISSPNVTQSVPGLVASAGQLLGTNTNDSASAGNVGEVATISRVRSNALTVTSSNNVVNIGTTTNIVLQPGNYTITAMGGIIPDATTVLTDFSIAVSQTSATLPSTDTIAVPSTGGEVWMADGTVSGQPGRDYTISIPSYDVKVATATTLTLYFVARTTFSAGTAPTVYGWMQANRKR